MDKYLGETLNWESRCLPKKKELLGCGLGCKDGLSSNLISMGIMTFQYSKDCP